MPVFLVSPKLNSFYFRNHNDRLLPVSGGHYQGILPIILEECVWASIYIKIGELLFAANLTAVVIHVLCIVSYSFLLFSLNSSVQSVPENKLP